MEYIDTLREIFIWWRVSYTIVKQKKRWWPIGHYTEIIVFGVGPMKGFLRKSTTQNTPKQSRGIDLSCRK